MPTVPVASDAVVTVNPSETAMDSAFDAVCPALDTWTVKLLVPDAVGVPEITPAEDRVMPPGRFPLDKDQL